MTILTVQEMYLTDFNVYLTKILSKLVKDISYIVKMLILIYIFSFTNIRS